MGNTYLIVGLGNPGKEYENTRHNIGYTVLDNFAAANSFPDFKKNTKFKGLISEQQIGSSKVVLLKPTTFMNLSGESVLPVLSYYKIATSNMLVICDDLDFKFGDLKIKPKGGPGTHNGLKSIVQHVGEAFPRMRIGIENREDMRFETSDFVLSKFSKDEAEILKDILKKAADAISEYLNNGIDSSMTKFN